MCFENFFFFCVVNDKFMLFLLLINLFVIIVGFCEVIFKNGSVMYILFIINCSGWEDVDFLLIYEFVFECFNKEFVFLIFQILYVNFLYFFMGQDKNYFNLILKIKVIDGFGVVFIVCISVKVSEQQVCKEIEIDGLDLFYFLFIVVYVNLFC